VLPVIERLARETTVPISIDTTKSAVARQAIGAGASIVNDISGLRFDPKMCAVCAQSDVGVICMHIQGTPRTMQQKPQYENVVREITDYFRERLECLERDGIPRERIVLDPGIGFGKTAEHNLEILAHIRTFRALDRPVLIGHSRKRFLEKVLGRAVDERTFGTVGVSVALAQQGVDILRVHDVRSVRDALMAWQAVTKGRSRD
jgi:dihydropteroate synthase